MPKIFKVNDLDEGDIIANSGWHGIVVGQEASEKNPKWLIRQEGHDDQQVSDQAIRLRGGRASSLNDINPPDEDETKNDD